MNRLFALLLYLFPKAYREEYSEELQAVFNLSVGDALERGIFEIAGVILRELSGLPQAIIHEHLRERRKAKMIEGAPSRFDFSTVHEQGSLKVENGKAVENQAAASKHT
jgi:hypothetical protein